MGTLGLDDNFIKLEALLARFYLYLPFGYRNYIFNLLKKYSTIYKRKSLLDIGCGDGTFTRGLIEKGGLFFDITGVELYKPYIKLAKKSKVYVNILEADILKFKPSKKYSIILISHIIEHFKKEEGARVISEMEKFADDLIVVITPIGFFPQSEYDGNIHQRHLSKWIPQDFLSKGYTVRSFGFKPILGDKNMVKEIGWWAYFVFIASYLFTPVMFFFPNLGTYMVAYKRLKK